MEIKDRKITFRTEIEFIGSVAEFDKLTTVLVDQPIRIRAEWPKDHTAGCWPIEPQKLISESLIEKFTIDTPRFKLMKPIPGGIRDPHLHIKDEIFLLGRDQFKELISQVSMKLAGDLASVADHVEAVGAIRNLVQKS